MHEINEHLSHIANDVLLDEVPVEMVGKGLDNVIQDIQVDESETISKTVNTLTTAHGSFESYIDSFFDTIPVENWSARTSRQFEIGLNAIAVAGGVSLESLGFDPSFEDVGKTQTPTEHREESKVKSKSILARIWEGIKRAFEKVYQFFMGMVDKVKRAEKWLHKADSTLSAKLVKARQTGSFKTGVVENNPKWARYLLLDNTTTSPSHALSTASENIFQVADAFGADTSDAADMELNDRIKFEGGRFAINVAAEHLGKISWPVKLPGNGQLAISGDTKNILTIKLEKTQKDGTPSKFNYISSEESTRFLSEFRGLVQTAVKVGDGFYRHARQYEGVREALRKEGEGKQPLFGDLTKLLAHYNSVMRTLILEIHQIAKMAYDHAMASVK